MKLLLAAGLAASLAACGGGGGGSPPPQPSPPAVVTITDPMVYLAQSRTPNGDTAAPLRDSDPISYMRFDLGRYQVETSFLAADGSAITTWSYPPFGPFVADNGDGGEQYVVEGDTIRITSTQDGSKPGVTVFPGPDGWVIAKTDATAEPKCFLARIGFSPGYTCYRMQTVAWPGLGAIETIIGERYDNIDPEHAFGMERIFLGRGWGRLAWQSWTKPPQNGVGLAERCPDFGWNVPPAGFVLNDCRIVINIAPADGSLTGAQLWHP